MFIFTSNKQQKQRENTSHSLCYFSTFRVHFAVNTKHSTIVKQRRSPFHWIAPGIHLTARKHTLRRCVWLTFMEFLHRNYYFHWNNSLISIGANHTNKVDVKNTSRLRCESYLSTISKKRIEYVILRILIQSDLFTEIENLIWIDFFFWIWPTGRSLFEFGWTKKLIFRVCAARYGIMFGIEHGAVWFCSV